MLPGLYHHRLTDESARTFFEDTWVVAPEADRIGYRYRQGRALRFREREQPFGAGADPSNIVDACYPIGSIQVPAGVEPIILHRDAVSGGGYATIGTVISADLDLIGQMQPNHQARFVAGTMADALAARRDAQRRLARLRDADYRARVDADGLRSLAYTLQVGREAMDERLAVIADSVQALEGKLRQFVDGKTDIQDLHVSRVGRSAHHVI